MEKNNLDHIKPFKPISMEEFEEKHFNFSRCYEEAAREYVQEVEELKKKKVWDELIKKGKEFIETDVDLKEMLVSDVESIMKSTRILLEPEKLQYIKHQVAHKAQCEYNLEKLEQRLKIELEKVLKN